MLEKFQLIERGINSYKFFDPEAVKKAKDFHMPWSNLVSRMIEQMGGEHMFHPTPEELRTYMETGLTTLYADQNNVAGFAKMLLWPYGIEIGSLVVDQNIQQKGIGSFLAQKTAIAARLYYPKLPIFAVVTEDNVPSQRLFNRLRWPIVSHKQSIEIIGTDVLEDWTPPSTIFLFNH